MTADFGAENLVVGDAAFGQRLQHRFFYFILGFALPIETSGGLVYHRLIISNALKVAAAAQIDGLLDPVLQMAVRTFHRAILIGFAFVVSRWCHPVVLAQIFVEPSEFLSAVATCIAVGGAKTVGAMFFWRATSGSQGILQPFR